MRKESRTEMREGESSSLTLGAGAEPVEKQQKNEEGEQDGDEKAQVEVHLSLLDVFLPQVSENTPIKNCENFQKRI
jgi:hypothetical protein